MISIMNKDATLNNEAGPYAGQDRFEGRKALVADLEREGLLVKVEPHTSSVGVSQRGGEVVEPLLSEQWFVRAEPLAAKALAAVKEGRTRIVPEHFERVYIHWLENIRDWCISRQLWWGHRIPVWHFPDGQMVVPDPDESPPEGATRDPDVLDTWFSSGLWPFSTLGWPDDTDDLRTFYPTSVMETAYDILFFWVARMMMMGCYLTDVEPFHTVYLHGLIRDEHGRKMSKTYGNVVNPLDVMDTHGTDALRFTQATSGTPGQDLNLNPQRIEAARNFANKIWNMTRFVVSVRERVGHPAGAAIVEPLPHDAPLANRWICSRYHRLAATVDRLLEGYNFGEAGRQIHDFLWSEFADWYIEVAKIQLEAGEQVQQQTLAVLMTVLDGGLRMLHPFMPFVTEAAWQLLLEGETHTSTGERTETLMYAPYPTANEAFLDEQAERDFGLLRDLVVGVRNVRTEYRVEPARWITATAVGGPHTPLLERESLLLSRLARIDADQLTVVASLSQKPHQAATLVSGEIEVFLPLSGLVDLAEEQTRLTKELEEAQADIARREQRLANQSFLEKAPEQVVQKERDGLAGARATVERLRERLQTIGGEQ
jgi:valyl-tRNA synthetase